METCGCQAQPHGAVKKIAWARQASIADDSPLRKDSVNETLVNPTAVNLVEDITVRSMKTTPPAGGGFLLPHAVLPRPGLRVPCFPSTVYPSLIITSKPARMAREGGPLLCPISCALQPIQSMATAANNLLKRWYRCCRHCQNIRCPSWRTRSDLPSRPDYPEVVKAALGRKLSPSKD